MDSELDDSKCCEALDEFEEDMEMSRHYDEVMGKCFPVYFIRKFNVVRWKININRSILLNVQF